MPHVKLFQRDPETLEEDSDIELSLLESEMNIFTLQPDIIVHQINGPYISHLPPEREGEPERIIYTANISYDKK